MSLDNLVGITIEKITPERNISDAKITAISAENRFDAACKAIMQLANAALQANGY